MDKILINRTDAIGDTLLTTALARVIKKDNPKAHVTILVSQRSGELIRFCEGIDDVLIFSAEKSFIQKITYLNDIFRSGGFSAYFHLGGSFYPTFISFLHRVRIRSGILSKMLSYLFLNCGLRQKRSESSRHEVSYNIDFAQVLKRGTSSAKSNYLMNDSVPRVNLAPLGKNFLEECGLSDNYIIVHPGMTGHTLNWPMNCYADLLGLLSQSYPQMELVVSYTPSDESYIRDLKSRLKDDVNITFFDGAKRGLIHYAQVVKMAALFIGPSTGTTHIANALGTPQVAIYSPIKVQSSKRWGPVAQGKHVAVFEPLQESDPMSSITVDSVMLAIDKILQVGGSSL